MRHRKSGPDLLGFEQYAFEFERRTRRIYRSGRSEDPPVLLCCELAGFSPGLIGFARRLSTAGFQVHVPWLFGRFGQRQPLRNVARLCISREFGFLQAGGTTPITRWLRALSSHVSRLNGDRNVGAIGMCLTGSFVIPLILNPEVRAAVAAHPAVPLSPLSAFLGISRPSVERALPVSAEHLEQARERLSAGNAHLLAIRACADRLSPAARLQRLRTEFPVGLCVREYGELASRNVLGERPHAMYTKEYRLAPDAPEDHWAQRAFADLVEFLKLHLDPHAAQQPRDEKACS